jgi:hypothetical protein
MFISLEERDILALLLLILSQKSELVLAVNAVGLLTIFLISEKTSSSLRALLKDILN